MSDQNNIEDFRKLIEKYLDGETNEVELQKLVSYYESFQKTHDWVEDLGDEYLIKNKMLSYILETIQDEKIHSHIVPFYNKPVFKYAIAATVVLLVAINVMVFRVDKNEITPILSDTETITIGTDKATLTLGDGTLVSLERGKPYKAAHVTSNGKEIIYDANTNDAGKIVYNYLTIPRGGQFYLKLSDGTQVWLNSESQLKYPVSFIPNQLREVELIYGEAYFDVSSSVNHNGAKFKVISGSQNVNVIGTVFNIRSYKTETEIVTTLVEGEVEIELENDNLLLNPNQQSVFDTSENKIDIQDVDVFFETSWVKGLYTFDDASLEEIMQTLARWYDFEIEFKNSELRSHRFTGVLERSKQIQDILQKIEVTGGISFQINNKIIVIE